MRTSLILLFLLAFCGSSCETAPSTSIEKVDDSTLKLEESLSIQFAGEVYSEVIFPKGTELPASVKKSVKSNQHQLLSALLYKENSDNQREFFAEFWFQQNKETDVPSEIEMEISANSNDEITIKAVDVETGAEKTMIFLDTETMTGKDEVEQYLSKYIHQLDSTGGHQNYAIFTLENGYFIQIAMGKDANLIRCEASISTGGPDGNRGTVTLPQLQITQLEALGWLPPDFGELNYFRWEAMESPSTLDEITRNFLETIYAAYDGSRIYQTTINLE